MAKDRPATGVETTLKAYFRGRPESRVLYEAACKILLGLGDVTEHVTRSQVAYWRRRPFAWLWIPAQYLRQADLAPLVLSIGLSRRDGSKRWKEVVEPRPGRFMNHLELRKPEEIDGRMSALMREAWDTVGLGSTPKTKDRRRQMRSPVPNLRGAL